MKILIDTNVILDYLLCREPYQEDAKMIINACKEKKVIGCIAAHTVSNIFFILRKVYSVKERRDILNSICQLFEVESINKGEMPLAESASRHLSFVLRKRVSMFVF